MRKGFVIMSVAILTISAGYHAYTMKGQAKLSDLALNIMWKHLHLNLDGGVHLHLVARVFQNRVLGQNV